MRIVTGGSTWTFWHRKPVQRFKMRGNRNISQNAARHLFRMFIYPEDNGMLISCRDVGWYTIQSTVLPVAHFILIIADAHTWCRI